MYQDKNHKTFFLKWLDPPSNVAVLAWQEGVLHKRETVLYYQSFYPGPVSRNLSDFW